MDAGGGGAIVDQGLKELNFNQLELVCGSLFLKVQEVFWRQEIKSMMSCEWKFVWYRPLEDMTRRLEMTGVVKQDIFSPNSVKRQQPYQAT